MWGKWSASVIASVGIKALNNRQVMLIKAT